MFYIYIFLWMWMRHGDILNQIWLYNRLSAAMDRVEVFCFRVGCTDIGANNKSSLLLFRANVLLLEFIWSTLSSSSSSSSPTSYLFFAQKFLCFWFWFIFDFFVHVVYLLCLCICFCLNLKLFCGVECTHAIEKRN